MSKASITEPAKPPAAITSPSQLTLFVEASPAKTCPLPDSGQDWLESAADFGSSSIAFLTSIVQTGWLSRMSPVFYPASAGETLPSSFEGWLNSGMASPGGCLMLNTSEWPSAAAVCSLSDILETDSRPRYFLSAKAARGILRRAEKRGRALPELLRRALTQAASTGVTQTT